MGTREGTRTSAGTVVLLADDERSVRELVRRVLVRAGYEVLTAVSGEQALDLARDRLDDIDLLLTDVIMPGLDGKALADALAALRPGVPVLFMSGYSRDLIARYGVPLSGVHFLSKPFSTDDLLHRVTQALGAAAPGD